MNGDTIAALSTPIGEGGIGIVRMSGPEAVTIADRFFRPACGESLAGAPSHTLHYGRFVVVDRAIDEVLVSVMRAPRTYTREDVVEINCHGGLVSTRAVLDALLAGGARMAERGEFTRRAFLNGRISLDQAKAVLDIVRAKTVLGLEAAVDRLGGRFSTALTDVRTLLAAILADLEVEIDYPDLDVDVAAIEPRVAELVAQIDRLLAQSEQGRIVREGLTVAIVGRPNVGKSTLLNALLAEDRAIVTPIPGTTRDTVEEEAPLDGIPVRWIDTAGLRETADPVEAEGVRRTQQAIDRSDLVLCLIDGSEPLKSEDEDLLSRAWNVPAILVITKTDLPTQWAAPASEGWSAVLEVSAKRGEGIELLRAEIARLLVGGELPTRNSVLLLDAWERDLIRRMGEALHRALATIRDGHTADMVAEDLRAAYRIAGELQGIDISESILDTIFERFCVGK